MADLESRLRRALRRAAERPDAASTAAAAEAVRAGAAAGGSASASSGAAAVLAPWIGVGAAGLLVAGALGWWGVFGGDRAATPDTGPVAAAIAAPTGVDYLDCPAGAPVGRFAPADRVLAVAHSGSDWVGVRDPLDALLTVWVPTEVLAPDAGQRAFTELPAGGCDEVAAEPLAERGFGARVRDATTGVGLGGVTVQVTDTGGVPIEGASTLTEADGSFSLAELPGEEYGLRVDGTAISYEAGFVGGADPTPIGLQVFPTWGEASTWAPGTVGDIALDPVAVTTTTTTTSTTVPATTVPPPATTTTTTVPNQPPTIGTLTASPNKIWHITGCGPIASTLSVNVTDATGVATVTVRWTVTTPAAVQGDATLTGPGGGGTWSGTVSGLPSPDPLTQFVTLVVTARDPQGLESTRTFTQSLTLEYCLI